MTDEEVRAAIQTALQHLIDETPVLDFVAVPERSTAHRLAVHMEPLFGAEWNIDVAARRGIGIATVKNGVWRVCQDSARMVERMQ